MMHSHSLAIFATLASLASAQLINIPVALDTPVPDLAIDLLAPPAQSYNAAAAAGTPLAIPRRRHLTARNDTCSPIAAGAGPVPNPDTSYAFLNSADLSDWAKNVSAPKNYTAAFTDLHASVTGNGYLGVSFLSEYSPSNCSAQCDAQPACTAINLYFERTPTLNPGSECSDPPSSTVIKCVFWGEAVTKKKALNTGYTEQSFVVVVAGSNGYNKGDAVKAAKESKADKRDISGLLVLMGVLGAVAVWV